MSLTARRSREQARPKQHQHQPQLRALLAATRATSPLLRGVLQQLRSGEPLGLSLAPHIDDARLAVRDGLVLGALSLSEMNEISGISGISGISEIRAKTQGDKLSSYRLASSELWWAHRGGNHVITEEVWRELIMGSRGHWPRGARFQLCLRALPDPLERIWSEANPTLAPALERARASGQWPIFDTDEQLVAHLNAHPGAMALFPVGNLKLWGAPLSQVSIQGYRTTRVVASLELMSARRWSEASTSQAQTRLIKARLEQLIMSLLDESERASQVREWGWDP